ncbi:MAG: MarR family transcriptional regulator [Ruminococcaceae bacterium]|nr:MarR family transcriptional regulator [Oscillospiraceae bacterium]
MEQKKSAEKLSNHELVRLFIHTDKLHRNLIEQRMSDLNLHRSQHIMLLCISAFETPPTQKDIAKKLDISAATVAVTIKKLEQAGFVTKATSDSDNRCNRVSITDEGRNILEQAKMIFENVDENMLSGLTNEELSNFVEYLKKIQANLRSDGATLPPHKCC